MKKLLAATLIALSITAQAESKFPDVLAASVGYVSSYSNAAVAVNLGRNETVGFTGYSNITRTFCGISGISGGGLLEYGYGNVIFNAPRDDFYLVLCIKSGGLSDDVIVVVAEPQFFGIQSRSVEQASDDDVEALENAFSDILN